MELKPGEIFARDYRVVRELGRGGMGAVFEVEQLSTAKRRALKLMDEGLLADEKSAERFMLEAKAGGNISSDHVVEVIAAGVEDQGGRSVPWLVMELLEGESLADAIIERGAMAPEQVKEVLRQLCHGLGAAHRAGLVHRDVKPDNIFLARARSAGERLKVKLLDFGIAKALNPTVGSAGTATAPMGTPLFMAPEQTRPGGVDARADVWALGLLAYHMLTAKHYWRSGNEAAIPLTHLLVELSIDPIEAPSTRAASQGVRVPAGFDAWFMRCVARDLAHRYPNADVAFKALEGRLSGEAFAQTMREDALAAGAVGSVSTRPDGGMHSSVPATQTPAALASASPAHPDAHADAAHAGHGPAAPANGGSSGGYSRLILGAGVLMLVVGGVAVGWALQGAESAPETDPDPVAGVAPQLVGDASVAPMEALAPRPTTPDAGGAGSSAEAPADEAPTTPRAEPTDEAQTEEPDRPRRARISPEERRARAEFIESARLGCRTFVASAPNQRVRVRVTHYLRADGSRIRWDVRPSSVGPCLASRAGYVSFPGTGQARQVTQQFVMRFPYP